MIPLLTEGQVSDLVARPLCCPTRGAPIRYDGDLYKQRNRIARIFVRLKGWRRIATRYDRSAHTVMSAIRIPATGIFWL